MKKTTLSVLLLLSITTIVAQETPKLETNDISISKNEVKINALYLVLGAFEGTYERLLNQESGVGISLFLPFDKDITDDINYYISPYYRFYFGEKYASGFFLEGFGMLSSVNEYESSFFGNDPVITSRKKEITDFALGIGLGGKWVTKRGFLGELNLGVGRNLFNTNEFYDNDIVAKIGITVGYRF